MVALSVFSVIICLFFPELMSTQRHFHTVQERLLSFVAMIMLIVFESNETLTLIIQLWHLICPTSSCATDIVRSIHLICSGIYPQAIQDVDEFIY